MTRIIPFNKISSDFGKHNMTEFFKRIYYHPDKRIFIHSQTSVRREGKNAIKLSPAIVQIKPHAKLNKFKNLTEVMLLLDRWWLGSLCG